MIEILKAWDELNKYIQDNKKNIIDDIKKAFNYDSRIFVTIKPLEDLRKFLEATSYLNRTVLFINFVDGIKENKGKIWNKKNVETFLDSGDHFYTNLSGKHFFSVLNLKKEINGSLLVSNDDALYNGLSYPYTFFLASVNFCYNVHYNEARITPTEANNKRTSYQRYIKKTLAEKLPKSYYIVKLLILAKRLSILAKSFQEMNAISIYDFIRNTPIMFFNTFHIDINKIYQCFSIYFRRTNSSEIRYYPKRYEPRFEMELHCDLDYPKNPVQLNLESEDKLVRFKINLTIPKDEEEQKIFLLGLNTLTTEIYNVREYH